MKASILKAVLWNSEGYVGPAGNGATSGYPKDHGFGHEEWNNHPDWIWRGYRVFHTESKDRLLGYSETGELGMLMIVSHDRRQYAVGVAAGVFHNTAEEMTLIAEELGLYEKWRELWAVDLVRKCHEGSKSRFQQFWREQCEWVRWKVDPTLYHWFDKPILLRPESLTDGRRLTTMFGSYQPVRPERVVSAIRKHLPASKEGILAWFEEGGFDERFLARKPAAKGGGASKSKNGAGSGGNSPATRDVRYWVYGERVAEPLHHVLQAQYVKYLTRLDRDPVENDSYVDVRYTDAGASVLVEVKPTEKVPPRYAIRAAIGQLMEYRHRLDPTARLEIVISTSPKRDSIDLLKSLGIRLLRRKGEGFERLA